MATSKEIANLVINKVESQTVYDYMVDNNLINDDELYFVETTGESDLEFDSALSSTSENAVQNKVVNAKFDEIESVYETKEDAQSKLDEAKGYADSILTSHIDNKNNPHEVTKEQVGLGNVDNTSDMDKPVSTAQSDAINIAKKAGDDAQANLDQHIDNKNNPHEVNLTQLGVTATADELNYIGGATSNIQEQLNGKMNKENPTGTGSFSLNRKADTTIGNYSFAEGQNTTASGTSSHAEGSKTFAIGYSSHAEGANAVAYNYYSHAEGCGGVIDITITGGASATTYTLASSNDKIKIGQVIEYNGTFSKIAAYDLSVPSITVLATLSTEALSSASAHIYQLAASGMYSHAEGYSTIASVSSSHAEGNETVASGDASHAEGRGTTASGGNSHAEGYLTIASGGSSHAEGTCAIASGGTSHAEGFYTIASSKHQHVQGRRNIEDANETYSHIVGNGTADNARSNAHTLDWSGNAWFSGDVYVGSTSGKNKDNGSRKLASITETWTFTLEDGSTVTKAVYVG